MNAPFRKFSTLALIDSFFSPNRKQIIQQERERIQQHERQLFIQQRNKRQGISQTVWYLSNKDRFTTNARSPFMHFWKYLRMEDVLLTIRRSMTRRQYKAMYARALKKKLDKQSK
jgi:hypothetical protein